MRLTSEQRATIKEVVAAHLGGDAQIYLFGSRTDDRRRGGDIDLLVTLPRPLDPDRRFDAKLKVLAALHLRLGERKIDLLLHQAGEDESAFQRIAREQGVRL